MPHHGDGPIPARFMVVGECWGADEERLGVPFMGASGQELNRMLGEAGILRSDCYVSNVVNYRPPDNFLGHWIALRKKDITKAHIQLRDRWVLPIILEGYQKLLKEIEMVQPSVIIPVGNLSMWSLTGHWGILKWRGSQLSYGPACVLPTIHPASVLREWSQRALVVNDLRRAKRMATQECKPPECNFLLQPSFEPVTGILNNLISTCEANDLTWIDFDIETARGHITCVGVSWSRLDALCIPFTTRSNKNGYWSEEEEAQIVYLLYKLLTHKKIAVRGQNLLYDCQYTFRHWHFVPNVRQDTMIAQHSAFSALPKGLGFLGSMYADYYVFWKEEGKSI